MYSDCSLTLIHFLNCSSEDSDINVSDLTFTIRQGETVKLSRAICLPCPMKTCLMSGYDSEISFDHFCYNEEY